MLLSNELEVTLVKASKLIKGSHALGSFVLFSLSIIVIFAQEPQESTKAKRDSYDLKGPVKTATWYSAPPSYSAEAYIEGCCGRMFEIHFAADGSAVKSYLGVPVIDAHQSDHLAHKRLIYKDAQVAEELRYNAKGSLETRTTYEYDSQGDKVRELIYSASGSLYRSKVFVYDPERRLVECTQYYGDGAPKDREVYGNFDSHGNWLKNVTSSWSRIDGQHGWNKLLVTLRVITYY